MLVRNNPWQLLNDLNSILDSGLYSKEKDDSNVESSRWIPAVDIKEETVVRDPYMLNNEVIAERILAIKTPHNEVQ